MGRNERVNFRPEVEAYGLRLCLCDMNRNNFMKDRWGRIVALDFGDSCLLPISFFNFALREGDEFTQLIARLVKHTETTQLNAMLTASYSLVSYGRNDIGERIPLLSFLFLASYSLARILTSIHCIAVPTELKLKVK